MRDEMRLKNKQKTQQAKPKETLDNQKLYK